MSQAEERYRLILETAPDAIVVVDSSGTIVFTNAQVRPLFGYDREELLGQRLDTLIPERFRATHGGHIARYFAHPGVRPMGSGLELFGRRKDGAEFPIEVSISPVKTPDGVLVSAAIRDISDRRRIEQAAKLTAERLTSAVESIQDAFVLFDGNDRLALCNSAYRNLIGDAVPGPLVGRTYEELLEAWVPSLALEDESERERFRSDRLANRRSPKGAVDVRTRDGRTLRVIDRKTPEGGIVKTIWDITDDMQVAEELEQARAAAEAGSAAKSEFLSSMSHELRTPLNAILGFAQLLQRDKREPLTERHQQRVEQILKGGEHLLRLIDDILDLARIEAGGVSISIEPVNVGDVLNEVKRTLEPVASAQNIKLGVTPPPLGLPMITADRTRYLQILMNFGSNAIKYNRPGGEVSFAVSEPTFDHVRVCVRDTGIGIPADKQEKLFQPFQRAGQETGPIEGTGIGLVITRRLARLMGGDVGFRSAPDQGSEFWVDIPSHAAPVESGSSITHSRESVAGHFAGGARRLALYVEDNPANMNFMRDLVSAFEDIDLLVAANAEKGVEIARELKPQVIIMDINLPGMSGIDALKVLQGEPATKDIPVIALTAAASERDRQRGTQAGFFRYLTKPVKVDELLDALEAVLNRPA